MTTYNTTGASCTLNSGDSNRVLTLPNTRLTVSGELLVYASGYALALTTEYTVDHKTSGTEITFLKGLWDDMTIVVSYTTTTTSKLPSSIFDQQIDYFGELVTLTVKSSKTYSDWGDVSEAELESLNIKAVYNVYGKPSSSQEEGKFQEGDITFFFKSDQNGLDRGNKVTRANGDVYSIVDPSDHGIQGNTYVYEVKVEKV